MQAPVMTQRPNGSASEITTQYLDDHDVPYKLFEHERRFTAAGEARASGIAPHNAAKSILLRAREGYVVAVIPASERLDLSKLRRLLGGDRRLRLATEQEMADQFPSFEVGALPPLGFILSMPEVIDERLLDHGRVLCNAGDHRHSMLLDPGDIKDSADSRVGDICAG